MSVTKLAKDTREGETSQEEILGWVFTFITVIPWFFWTVQAGRRVLFDAVCEQFSPIIEPKELWYLTIPALVIAVTLAMGWGSKIVETALSFVRSKFIN